ncbi:MAG: PaaI family thioesterase [Pseudomonadota bacterium]
MSSPGGHRAVQDGYPESLAHCYGCGRNNRDGLHVRTFAEGDHLWVARFTPRPEHIALPGFVYGGLLASLIDCHAIATAAAGWTQAFPGRVPAGETPRFVTGSLKVDFLKPTPLGPELRLDAVPREPGERKVWVDVAVWVEDKETVRGEVLAVRVPDAMS